MQVGYGAGLWSFLSYGRPGVTTAAGYRSTPEEFRQEVAERRQRDAGAAPILVTTPEKFRALIAAKRADRAAAECNQPPGRRSRRSSGGHSSRSGAQLRPVSHRSKASCKR
jgi:hypothetical protein